MARVRGWGGCAVDGDGGSLGRVVRSVSLSASASAVEKEKEPGILSVMEADVSVDVSVSLHASDAWERRVDLDRQPDFPGFWVSSDDMIDSDDQVSSTYGDSTCVPLRCATTIFARNEDGETFTMGLFSCRAFRRICLFSSFTLDDETIRIGLSLESINCGCGCCFDAVVVVVGLDASPLGLRMLTFLE